MLETSKTDDFRVAHIADSCIDRDKGVKIEDDSTNIELRMICIDVSNDTLPAVAVNAPF